MSSVKKLYLDGCRSRHRVLKPLFATLLLAAAVAALGQSSVQYDYTNFVGYPGGAAGTNDGLGTVARFSNPTGVAVDSNGNIFIADQWNALIRKVNPSGMVSTVVGAAAKLWRPSGVTVGPSGNVFFTDTMNNTVKQVGLNGAATIVAGSNSPFQHGTTDGYGTVALFSNPFGLVADNNGNIFVADTGNHTIRKISLVGATWVVTTIAGDITQTNSSGGVLSGSNDGTNTAARFKSPNGLAIDGAGNLYVADTGNYTIRKIAPMGTDWVTTTLAGSPGQSGSASGTNSTARFNGADGIAVDNVGNLFVADSGNSLIRKMTLIGTNWVVTTIGGGSGHGTNDGIGTMSRFYQPAGIAVDATGTLFVADTSNNRISKGVSGTAFEMWQLEYFGCTSCPNAAPNADPLGKGINNWNQFLAGLNPTNPGSVFAITQIKQTGSNFVVTWKTAGRNTNIVQVAGDRLTFSDLSGPITITATGDTITNYTDLGGATKAGTRFYRVRLGP